MMARGWESKSVENQIDDASSERSSASDANVTPEERARRNRRTSLLLARTKAANDLAASRNPQHRAMLERAIADLDAQLAAGE
jgi:hypothetical protein